MAILMFWRPPGNHNKTQKVQVLLGCFIQRIWRFICHRRQYRLSDLQHAPLRHVNIWPKRNYSDWVVPDLQRDRVYSDSIWPRLTRMAHEPYARDGSERGQQLAEPPNIPRGHRQRFKDALVDVSRRVLRRKSPDEEGVAEPPPSPSKVRRDTAIPKSAAAKQNVLAKGRTTAQKLGKRKRNIMGYDIAIHEDQSATTQHLQPPEYQVMTESDPNVQYSDENEDDDESEDEIDETVAEDMHKLEESFTGISQKYRLINRIGEGMLVPPETRFRH